MAFKRVFGRLIGILILVGVLLFGMSGLYHEAPWIVTPAIGSVKIEIAGERMSANAEALDVTISSRELPLLNYFTRLRRINFKESVCYREIYDWAGSHPEVEVVYTVPLAHGKSAKSTDRDLDLSWMRSADLAAVVDALRYLPNVQRVLLPDVGGEQLKVADLEALQNALQDAEFLFSVVIGGKTFDSRAASLDLHDVRGHDLEEMSVVLACMKNLQEVEFGSESDGAIDWNELATLKVRCPNVHFRYSFTLYGKPVTLDTERMDFRGIPVYDNGDALYKALYCMNNCSYVDMDGTGVSDESMARLQEYCPQTRIVWRIWFGENYSVRTDAERILASKPTVGGMIYDASMLRYCTDMKYLDLGHNDELADLSFVSSMPKLEVLIIAMTAITDISPLRNCPKLEYLELNSTAVSDLSPLSESTALRHLNIAGCPKIKDISPLYNLTGLERLWIGRDTPVPAEQVQRMRAAAPGCNINTTAEDPHGEAWRFTRYDPEEPKYYWVPRYELLREQMGYNYQEYSFYWLDPLCDREAPEEYRGMYGKEVYG